MVEQQSHHRVHWQHQNLRRRKICGSFRQTKSMAKGNRPLAKFKEKNVRSRIRKPQRSDRPLNTTTHHPRHHCYISRECIETNPRLGMDLITIKDTLVGFGDIHSVVQMEKYIHGRVVPIGTRIAKFAKTPKTLEIEGYEVRIIYTGQDEALRQQTEEFPGGGEEPKTKIQHKSSRKLMTDSAKFEIGAKTTTITKSK